MSRRVLAALTALVALITLCIVAVLPAYRSESCHTDQFNQPVCTTTDRLTIPEENGRGVLLILAIPAAVAAAGLIRPTRNALLVIAAVLTALLLPAAMSVGIFFAPTALVAWIVAVLVDHQTTT
jgi:hypothetical protein